MTNTKTKTKRKTFADIYNEEKAKPTAAQQFVTDTAKALGVTEQTIRIWLVGKITPSRFLREKIEEHFGSDIKTLFPNYNK